MLSITVLTNMLRTFVAPSRRPVYIPARQASKWTDLLNKKFEAPAAPTQIDPQLYPRLKPGQTVYESSDFSIKARPAAIMRDRMNKLMNPPKNDVFQELNLDPIELWKSPTLLSRYITQNGKIIPGYINMLSAKSQRQIAKAIRRCRAAGLLSTVHKSVFNDVN